MQHARKRKIFLHPGEFVFAEPGTHIHTVLGSCIAITLWHPALQIGGMCHFVLPGRPAGEVNQDAQYDGRYGDEAMKLFELAARLHCTQLNEYRAKIFGGADMYGNTENMGRELIGSKNSEKAIRMLMACQVEVEVAHVGESGHRRVVFDVENGDVWVKHVTEDGHRLASTSGPI